MTEPRTPSRDTHDERPRRSHSGTLGWDTHKRLMAGHVRERGSDHVNVPTAPGAGHEEPVFPWDHADFRNHVLRQLAFEFLVLTAARSGEVRLATWDEMDLDAGVWAIPAVRMKAKRDHRVPLSGRALAILHDVQKLSDGTGLVFRSLRGKPLSSVTLPRLTKELGIAAVPHGFRSSFRDWAAERTNTPREVVEAALAHTVQNPTEAAYARSDLFERRRRLMDDWPSAIYTR